MDLVMGTLRQIAALGVKGQETLPPGRDPVLRL
jgi:hypothetical protein